MPRGKRRILFHKNPIGPKDLGITLEVLVDESGSPLKVSYTWCRNMARAKFDQVVPLSLDENPPLREGLLQLELQQILGTNAAHLVVEASRAITKFLIGPIV
ncbi:MAG: hypothetical protein A2172_00145 [Candidatus Woykebacteria bacterium RBG_13_40_15]|uniref:Uncharacterized protein n=1 Tax=Candidatus Woykebacteria bacterium RBG_13_40_15 TaxID=1802593 RepID=A0A1G1WAB7_9BACT|nr:MAG: hypothetical protein A2172_00145 [Candidatus Woykebacteria bacterium RBG_13_40_15]